MSENICAYKHLPVNGGRECGQPREGGDHDASFHTGCQSNAIDRSMCMLHEFQPGEAEHVKQARELRKAAVIAGDNGATALCEALHLKAQAVFEAGEAARQTEEAGLYAVVTDNSIYLVRFKANGQKWVLSRTSLRDDEGPVGHLAYSGWVTSVGTIRVGRRFSFEWSQQPKKGPINVSQVRSITRLG